MKQVWFITGASKGLGLTLVKRLLAEGHSVAATSRDAATLIQNVGGANPRLLPLEVNLSDEDSVESAVSLAIERFGHIDTLVNNAGYGQTGAVEEVSDQEVRENFEVNVFGLLTVTRAVLSRMREKRSGHIYNISSIGGFTGAFSGWGIYCATKFAVAGLTESLHADVKDLGIQVTLVYPGYFRTSFLEKESMRRPERTIAGYEEAKRSIEHHSSTLNRQQPGDPEKLAKVLIDLSHRADAPLHLFLGADAYELAHVKMKNVTSDLEKNRNLSVTTGYT